MTWRFLIDANLPVALARAIAASGVAATHVADIGSDHDEDETIWQLAEQRGDVIVSKDGDFAALSVVVPNPVPVVWIRLGNTRKQALIGRILSDLTEIIAALEAGERIVEVR